MVDERRYGGCGHAARVFKERFGRRSRGVGARPARYAGSHARRISRRGTGGSRSADVVLLFLGEEAGLSGEAASRAYLDLPGAQEELVNEVAKAGRPMIAVMMAGRPLTFHNVAEKMKAVLWAWHPGTMGGPAIVDALLGASHSLGQTTGDFPAHGRAGADLL